MLSNHRLVMPLSKHRMAIILFFAMAGIALSATLLSHNAGNYSKPSKNYIVPGRPAVQHLEKGYVHALIMACTALELEDDIPDTQKELLKYSVDLYQDTQIYRIKFIAERLPTEDGSERQLKKAVTYWISKATGRVTHSTFE